jgi:transposase
MALRNIRETRSYRRGVAVLSVAQGRSVSEVARLLRIGPRAIHLWVNRYRHRHRVEDLMEGPRSGRPRTAPALSDARIVRAFKRDPLALGYRATTWTVPLLAEHLKSVYHCPITRRTLRRRMKTLGLVWKRPRHVYKDPAPHVGQKKGASCGVCGT